MARNEFTAVSGNCLPSVRNLHIGISVDYSKDDDLLFKALSQMDEIYRMPIYLHYYEGYSHKEIAGILKSSEATISKRISRGKEELRKRLEE